MPFGCFRAGRSSEPDDLEGPRPVGGSAKKTRAARVGSADSRSSTTSNDSISRLPPCMRPSQEQLEKLMMPVPPEPRPSRCLRLSQPKTYSDIVYCMKMSKGCRDWRSFAVFHDDEVDMKISAVEAARKRALDYQRKVRRLESSSDDSNLSVAFDMIG